MKIKEAAIFLNTTPKTLRFYEEKGLIYPRKDKSNQYRTYSHEDLYRISTILSLREIGMSIPAIKSLLDNPTLSDKQYLDIQRSALFEQWIEMRDMIETVDKMLLQDDMKDIEPIRQLTNHLKKLKEIRRSWTDRWNFDNQAANYDNNIKKDGHVFNIHDGYDQALAKVVDMVQISSGKTVIDIGIGTGNLGSRFLSVGARVIGVDQSTLMLQKCKEKYPQIETRKGHFLALPLLDQSADAIVSSYALHHLTDEDKLFALEEMLRVIKPGGQICIADLMFHDNYHRKKVISSYLRNGNKLAVESIEDEYFADKSRILAWLTERGLFVKAMQFNDILGLIYIKVN
ncbi:MerR family transcriptional regulator [Ornithinibacillus bavariensis]|uniref:HTH merR-type domain-containing protein n=1 Tax=Ornithinibacillus bavariensis TaxID=545502 RepID=A0A920C7I0_9BACI|nr:methyltransferase domain-containing protein [Ornithinibacillus bavariensis]GIO26712.1 hypothetical protein J43TS3_13230 [Ornithinibacillus bavariensis]